MLSFQSNQVFYFFIIEKTMYIIILIIVEELYLVANSPSVGFTFN